MVAQSTRVRLLERVGDDAVHHILVGEGVASHAVDAVNGATDCCLAVITVTVDRRIYITNRNCSRKLENTIDFIRYATKIE